MSFADLLAGFIGSTVEVFLTNQLFIGTLESVESCIFTIRTNNTYYYGPSVTVTIVADEVQYVRVIV
ncbi:hypothetical protein [Paenibacillus sedimenti]|uniref:Uncharacterized protein n=1 Tax=Paenibacillus sedimenti TaxID=2770274 RepID=A0A926KT00_9BACL|nr:hypothetical protein [Paenibacillus sedimenti]MBD0381599.1 hypothetical protein [Paenibacillus sedimenti]